MPYRPKKQLLCKCNLESSLVNVFDVSFVQCSIREGWGVAKTSAEGRALALSKESDFVSEKRFAEERPVSMSGVKGRSGPNEQTPFGADLGAANDELSVERGEEAGVFAKAVANGAVEVRFEAEVLAQASPATCVVEVRHEDKLLAYGAGVEVHAHYGAGVHEEAPGFPPP